MEAILAKIAYIGILSNVRFIHNFVLLRVRFRQVSIYYEVLFKISLYIDRVVTYGGVRVGHYEGFMVLTHFT
jgi:hypothetical protein